MKTIQIKSIRFFTALFLFCMSFTVQSAWDSSAPIQPIPLESGQAHNKVLLGKMLFNEPMLSHDNIFSCASCHQIEQGGDDGLDRSITNKGERNIINTPTVFNIRYNFRQTWEGFFKTLEDQAEGDILYPEHGNSKWPEVIAKLQVGDKYKKQFKAVYKSDITRLNIMDAIATYERSLITPNSRFDQYMRGNENIITKEEKLGYKYFKEYGCVACHQGINVGGNMFQKFGLFDDYFKWRGNVQPGDYGRFNVTKNEKDKFIFRVPSLRNIAVTSPYLHDGSVKDLDEVVTIMAKYQLGTSIQKDKISAIVAFLKTLTGKYQGKLLVDSK